MAGQSASAGAGSAAPTAAAEQDPRLEDLLASFARVEQISDPLERAMARLREAKRLRIRERRYSALFRIYNRKRVPRLLLEPQLRRLVDWSSGLSLFKLFGRLAILLAIGTFFAECPTRLREARFANLRVVESAQHTEASRARIDALEKLNEGCFDLAGIHAENAQLTGLRLDGCYPFPGGWLIGRWLPGPPRGAGLYRAHLDNADLRSAHLPHANLSFASLAGAWFEEADLTEARLRGANLTGAHLLRANLRGADLQDAILDRADLSGADLSRAKLTGARLHGAVLTDAVARGGTLQYADLQGVKAARAEFSGADFFKAKLQQGFFYKAHFNERTSLDSAELGAADLRGVVGLRADAIRGANDVGRALLDPDWRAPAAKPLKVALMVLDWQYFFREVRAGAEQAARERGVAPPDVRVVAAEVGAEIRKEKEIVDRLIAEGFDGILIVPLEKYGSAPEMRVAFGKGLVLVCYDHCIDPEDARRYVTADFESDQFELGKETGEAVAQALGSPRQGTPTPGVGILRYCKSEGCFVRVKGFRTALDEAGVDWVQAASYLREAGDTSLKRATAMLNDHPEITVAWSANEEGTEGLVKAVRSLRRQGQVKVWGTDISPTIASMLLDRDSILQAVTAQEPWKMGYRAMSTLIAALRRETPETGSHHTDIQFFERTERRPIERYQAKHPAS
ncbi:MAG TPA: pentapeptide repeat-containing protein [Thermoanaerobaculia bacterium]|nr:pentapeptide repeat-containing protein [Thermoanaerobaculia bacterium]